MEVICVTSESKGNLALYHSILSSTPVDHPSLPLSSFSAPLSPVLSLSHLSPTFLLPQSAFFSILPILPVPPLTLYFYLSPTCLLSASPAQTLCRRVGHSTTRRTWCQRDGWRGGRRPKGLLGNSLLRTHPLGIFESLAQGTGTASDGPPAPS